MMTLPHSRQIFISGSITTIMVICLTLLDIIIGSSSGGDLTAIPQTAADKFIQFQDNKLLGLYGLDFLNLIVSFIMIPSFLALFVALKNQSSLALPALFIFSVGTTIFIANNAALPFLELSQKYASSTTNEQRTLLAAAGEALIVKGAHGSYGVFPGFILITFSEFLISLGMLQGNAFSKTTAYMGLTGTGLLILYLILVTFVPDAKESAMLIAAPGGILSLLWMIMFTGKLFDLVKKYNKSAA